MNENTDIKILANALNEIGAKSYVTWPDGDGLGGYIELIAGDEYTTIYFEEDGTLSDKRQES